MGKAYLTAAQWWAIWSHVLLLMVTSDGERQMVDDVGYWLQYGNGKRPDWGYNSV